jgi:hypothetical protein
VSIINPAGTPSDPRIGPDQTSSPGARRQSRDQDAASGNDAANVTLSNQAAVLTQTHQLAGAENEAAALGAPEDVDRAAQLVKQLAAQIAKDPTQAKSAQARLHPRAVLNLIS